MNFVLLFRIPKNKLQFYEDFYSSEDRQLVREWMERILLKAQKKTPQTLNWNNWSPYYLHSWLSVWNPRNASISFNNPTPLFFALLVHFTQMWLTWSWMLCDKSCEMVELFFTVFTYLFCTSLIESLHFTKSALAFFARFSLCSLVTLKHTSVIVQ